MSLIAHELKKMNLSTHAFSIMEQRAETILARISLENGHGILKCYRTEDAKREIANYALLAKLGVPTPRLLAKTDSAILMEDLSNHSINRLGLETDLSSPEAAEKIAFWYRQLHEKGKNMPPECQSTLYEEASLFTRENMQCIARQTNTQSLPIWNALPTHADQILSIYHHLSLTLNYNDFYYTNLAIAHDFSSAMMFDYHLLGRGYAYADVRNVCSSLSADAQKAFLTAYGPVDPLEEMLDAILSPIVSLYLACKCPTFPAWAQDSLNFLKMGMNEALERLVDA